MQGESTCNFDNAFEWLSDKKGTDRIEKTGVNYIKRVKVGKSHHRPHPGGTWCINVD